MPRLLSSAEDDSEWLSEPSTVNALLAQDVHFLPIDEVLVTDKGALLFNTEYSVKCFVWKSRTEFKFIMGLLAAGVYKMFVPVEVRKYPRLAEGDCPDDEGAYVPPQHENPRYVFTPKAKTEPAPSRRK